MATFLLLNSTPPIAKPLVKFYAKQKQGHLIDAIK